MASVFFEAGSRFEPRNLIPFIVRRCGNWPKRDEDYGPDIARQAEFLSTNMILYVESSRMLTIGRFASQRMSTTAPS